MSFCPHPELASCASRLERAVAVFERDPLAVCQFKEARRYLAHIRRMIAMGGELETAADWIGPNMRGPAIDLVCRMAEEMSSRRVAA